MKTSKRGAFGVPQFVDSKCCTGKNGGNLTAECQEYCNSTREFWLAQREIEVYK